MNKTMVFKATETLSELELRQFLDSKYFISLYGAVWDSEKSRFLKKQTNSNGYKIVQLYLGAEFGTTPFLVMDLVKSAWRKETNV